MTSPSYSRHSPGKFSVWMDWETTGADFEGGLDGTFKKYQGIALGAIIADNDTFQEIDSLYIEIKFDDSKYEWTDAAEKMHGLSKEHLAANGLSREEALEVYIEFLTKHFGDGIISAIGGKTESNICVGGHNVQFDICASAQLFGDFGFNLGIHHVVLDTTSAAFIAIGKYKSNDVFSFFNGAERTIHNALEDARLALSAARSIKELVEFALR